MWLEFEWENKVAVNTDIADLGAYLRHVLSITNMNCITPQVPLVMWVGRGFFAAGGGGRDDRLWVRSVCVPFLLCLLVEGGWLLFVAVAVS